MQSLPDLRVDYQKSTLSPADLFPSPLIQFQTWLNEALAANIHEANAMCLATVDKNNCPDARIVLLKYIDNEKLGFYTNYDSNKGQQMAAHSRCSVVFFWKELERQVRIKAHVQRMDDKTSTAYFQSRPLDSQLAAWASPQSQPILDRQILENKWADTQQQFAEQTPLPKPPNWGGYFLTPYQFEFWQGRSSRLHDRFVYNLADEYNTASGWSIVRLAP